MRNRLYLIGFIVFAFSFCNAQSKTDFTILPNWKKGETKKMTVINSGVWIMNGEENSFPSDTSAVYSIEIIDKTKDGYLLEWKTILNDNEIEEVDFMKNYMLNFKYIIVTDSFGRFKELQNWKSLIELNTKFKKIFITEAKKENVSELELSNMISEMKLAETKTDLIRMCNNLTDIFLGNYGEHLKLNDTDSEQTTIPNQHFKEGIPATSETITKEINDEQISIKYSYIYDYDKLEELHEKHYPDQEYSEKKTISNSEFTYNTKTGWIDKIQIYNEFEDQNSKT
jgi:hypothetical protein